MLTPKKEDNRSYRSGVVNNYTPSNAISSNTDQSNKIMSDLQYMIQYSNDNQQFSETTEIEDILPPSQRNQWCISNDSAKIEYEKIQALLKEKELQKAKLIEELEKHKLASEQTQVGWKEKHKNLKEKIAMLEDKIKNGYEELTKKLEYTEEQLKLAKESFSYRMGQYLHGFWDNIWSNLMSASRVLFIGGTSAIVCYTFIKFVWPRIPSIKISSGGSEPPEPPGGSTILEDSIVPKESGFWRTFFKMLIQFMEKQIETGKSLTKK